MKDIVLLRFYIVYQDMNNLPQYAACLPASTNVTIQCYSNENLWNTLVFRALRGPTHYISIITNIMRTWTTQIWYGLLYHLRWTVRCCHFLLVDSLGKPRIGCLSLIYLVRPYVKTQCFQVTKYMYHNMPNFWGPVIHKLILTGISCGTYSKVIANPVLLIFYNRIPNIGRVKL